MPISLRPAQGGNDCMFAHRLILNEVVTGHFDAGLSYRPAQVGLMMNLETLVTHGSRKTPDGRTVPGSFTVAEIDDEPAGFVIASIIELNGVRMNELWLGAVDRKFRRRGVMSRLLEFFCRQLDQQEIAIAARILPASIEMRHLLAKYGFAHVETLPTGQAFLLRKPQI